MISYSLKIKIFKILRKIFKIFNLEIFYTKKQNFLKDLNVTTVIDVGVAEGTKLLLDNFPKANFILVEPHKKYQNFLENKLLKKYKGRLIKKAAGKHKGKGMLSTLGLASSLLDRKDVENQIYRKEVEIDKIDNLISQDEITNKTLLKVDTEGYELEVLKGAETILNKIDYCIVEVRLQKIETYNASELISYLYEKKFYFHKILKVYYAKYGIDFVDVLFIKKTNN